MTTRELAKRVSIDVENIGGIDRTSHAFERGITVLSGENATNRTSLLRAITAGLGSDRASLKADTDQGRVALTIGDRTYERTVTRRGRSVDFDGEPFADDTTAADLFAFLLGDNDVRQAIRSGGDPELLRDLVMAPIDTDALEREQRELQNRIRELEETIEDLERAEEELPELEERRRSLQRELEEIESEITETEADLEATSTDVSDTREQQNAFESAVEALQRTRSELGDAEYDLESERETLARLTDERDSVADELAALDLPAADESKLKRRRAELESEREAIQKEINRLSNVVEFNEEMLSGDHEGVAVLLSGGPNEDRSDPDITEQLVEGDETACWTCGQSINKDDVRVTVDAIKRYKTEKMEARKDVDAEIDAVEEDQREIRERERERERREQRLDSLDRQIRDAGSNIDAVEERIDELEREVDEREREVEQLETTKDHEEILDVQSDLQDLRVEKRDVERRLSRTEEEIEALEEKLAERDERETELEEKREALQERRTRIQRLERDVVEGFNEHMDVVLDILEYENVARVRIDARTEQVRVGRGTEEKTVFDLTVVRESNEGSLLTDDVEHLSESEREVVGLVFALAGYLAHDVSEEMPFVLLDSLEALDADRIASVVDYFAEHGDYVVTALLPEDETPTATLDESSDVIREI